ncbi:hypothetical protein NDA11_004391 [Ustilago hordei]|uniref:Urea transporter n=1 Tax=Ustilago hordei TaxID=120017 RepID=I2G047_USTHO|nr:uncharacterized protein UHO2_03669 [Ustilago hordei]KAJ1044095.1 hypothetical protein NDA10_008041 [Ustilago hordei]KAJ1578996.1 hypothetical protein NDA15_003687 [Ustilago hordei]KAJ1580798.1 hypothetical protein NDA12_006781 [Ustilago hordei]KAJ1581486.1 hypothetical protein NDA11_004391 [Ustilago hordei]KAJ1597411.1 hypothetical protein NDA14_007141 [Ustilago hordei]
MLPTSQANALVYSTLCGFLLVGLFAGYKVRNTTDFLSGLRTQSVFPLTLNWIASNMSSSLFFGYPQLAVIPNAGILGLAAYCFSTVAPLWVFAWLGPQIRRICPDGFTLSEYIRRRYGWPVGVLSALIFVGFMFCFMLVELNTYGSTVNVLGGVNPTIAALVIALITTIYTAYGGFKASLYTDNANAIIIMIFIVIASIAVGVNLDIDHARVESSGLLKPQRLGGELWYILTAALVFSQMFNQGFWQRVFASKNNKALYLSVAFATIPLFAICFIVGMAGPLAWWSGLFDGPTAEDDGSLTFFYIINTLPNWVTGIVIVLAGCLSSSAYDTFQSAQISTIQNDVFLGRLNIWWCRLILVCINVPSVVLAVKNIDILEVFLIADLAGIACIPAFLLGLIPKLYFLNGVDAVGGAVGGFLTVFLFGTAFYGNAADGIKLIGLPNGLYLDDFSVLGAFFAAPLGSIGWTFATCAIRAGLTWLYCRYTGNEYKVFEYREFDVSKWALPEDRPADFHGIHGSGNPDDGHKLEDNALEGRAKLKRYGSGASSEEVPAQK